MPQRHCTTFEPFLIDLPLVEEGDENARDLHCQLPPSVLKTESTSLQKCTYFLKQPRKETEKSTDVNSTNLEIFCDTTQLVNSKRRGAVTSFVFFKL